MTPSFDAYMEAASIRLGEARQVLALGIPRVAAREAYLAAFNAAQAFILHHSGKIAKTHSGVRGEFARLSRDEPAIQPWVAKLLASGYQQKVVADYGDAILESPITREMAADMIDRAADVLRQVADVLARAADRS